MDLPPIKIPSEDPDNPTTLTVSQAAVPGCVALIIRNKDGVHWGIRLDASGAQQLHDFLVKWGVSV